MSPAGSDPAPEPATHDEPTLFGDADGVDPPFVDDVPVVEAVQPEEADELAAGDSPDVDVIELVADEPGPRADAEEPEGTEASTPTPAGTGAPDLDLLLEEAADAQRRATELLDRLAPAEAEESGEPPGDEAHPEIDDAAPRSHDERMAAVQQVVEAATPERQVRTPAERKAALEAALAAAMPKRQVRTEEERRQAVAEVVDAQIPQRVVRTPERRREDLEQTLRGLMRDRQARSDTERMADAKRAADEAIAAREAAKAELAERVAAVRAAKDAGNGSGQAQEG